jgi:hypothetical protein
VDEGGAGVTEGGAVVAEGCSLVAVSVFVVCFGGRSPKIVDPV